MCISLVGWSVIPTDLSTGRAWSTSLRTVYLPSRNFLSVGWPVILPSLPVVYILSVGWPVILTGVPVVNILSVGWSALMTGIPVVYRICRMVSTDDWRTGRVSCIVQRVSNILSVPVVYLICSCGKIGFMR